MPDYTLIVDYCAKEVHRQGDSAPFVAHMFRAWDFLWDMIPARAKLTEFDIMWLGAFVKDRTSRGYRTTPVTFRSGGPAVAANNVPRAIQQLLLAEDLDPDEFCYEFLKIHPFEDGNGRVASLIHNHMSGTLAAPHPLPVYKF